MQNISPFLWFDGRAEEAMNFYASVFKNAKALGVTHYGKAGPGPEGSVMTARVELNGQEFILLNGGPQFQFSPAVSFVVNCDTQEEIDEYWEKLSAGGATNQCGWLDDKFGLSWQIVPADLGKWMSDADAERSNRVMEALLGMTKLDLNRLKQVYDQGTNVSKPSLV